jgi:exosortase/archaeosortase
LANALLAQFQKAQSIQLILTLASIAVRVLMFAPLAQFLPQSSLYLQRVTRKQAARLCHLMRFTVMKRTQSPSSFNVRGFF